MLVANGYRMSWLEEEAVVSRISVKPKDGGLGINIAPFCHRSGLGVAHESVSEVIFLQRLCGCLCQRSKEFQMPHHPSPNQQCWLHSPEVGGEQTGITQHPPVCPS